MSRIENRREQKRKATEIVNQMCDEININRDDFTNINFTRHCDEGALTLEWNVTDGDRPGSRTKFETRELSQLSEDLQAKINTRWPWR